jgi:acetyl/propionyl-CoA carboxylase alpha subunit
MYYDPMISKLIAWGKDRKTAMDLLNDKLDEYVVQGVAHNIGFGKSIVENEAFMKGDYSTAFIPTYYPDGYHGCPLTLQNKQAVALAAFKIKNTKIESNKFVGSRFIPKQEKTLYVTIAGYDKEKDQDFKVEFTG